MTTVLTLLSLVPPLILGFLLVSLLWSKQEHSVQDVALRACLSVGVGFGVSSIVTFAWMLGVGRLTGGLFLVELLLIAALSVLLVRCRRTASLSAPCEGSRSNPVRKPYWMRAAVAIAAVSAVVRFVCLAVENPDGLFDAFAIWDMHARFLYRAGADWMTFRYMIWTHPDYPLLIPASIARCWEFSGHETQLIPIAIAFLFTFSLIGLVSLSIARLRSERQGLLAALILLGTPFLIQHGASLYVDVPLSCLFAASLSLFLLHAELNLPSGTLILAGITSGLAAWTKNEGVLFVAVFFGLQLLVSIFSADGALLRKNLRMWLIGCAPLIVVIVLYKVLLGGSNDVISGHNLTSSRHQLLEMSRYNLVAQEYAQMFFNFGRWNQRFPIPALLLLYGLLVGVRVDKRSIPAASLSIFLPPALMAGYFFTYILSPHDLRWHVEASLDRLYLQVWPLALTAYFTIVQTPEQALAVEPVAPRSANTASLEASELAAAHAGTAAISRG